MAMLDRQGLDSVYGYMNGKRSCFVFLHRSRADMRWPLGVADIKSLVPIDDEEVRA